MNRCLTAIGRVAFARLFSIALFALSALSAFAQTPTISSFAPTTVGSGMPVIITGTGFTGATTVKFNGVSAAFTVNSDTQITATVPTGAVTGAITITGPGGTGTSATNITYTTAPIITSVSPASGPVKSIMRITGANFAGFDPQVVKFNGVESGYPKSWWSYQIDLAVPVGATSGPITIQTSQGTATSPINFTVASGAPPANDDFGSPQVLGGASGTFAGSNVNATKQTAEPNHGGNAGGTSVWFSWTAPSSGSYVFYDSSGNFGANLGLYTGAAVNALTAVASGNANSAYYTYNSAVVLNATAGTAYAIALDGYDGYSGNYTLAWSPLVAPTVTGFTPSSAYAGQTITIMGTGFVPGSTVTIGGVATNSSRTRVNSPTSISVDQLPFAAVTGPVVVTTPAGTATSATNLTVTPAPAPVITSFSPAIGSPGTYVMINGTALALGDALPVVRFNGVPVTSFSYDTSTALFIYVPTGATNGPIIVQTSAGTATSSTNFLVTNAAPVITTQPQPQAVSVGTNVTFAVTATGNPAPTYQWQKDGVIIAGATSASLFLSNIQSNAVGSYTCAVSNSMGNVTTNAATLSILTSPALTTQPASQVASPGGSATFSVIANGGNLSYQWFHNGVAITGATNATLSLTNLQVTDAGSYTVTVTNSAGSVTSNAVTLTGSNPAPTITSQPQNIVVTAGQPATLTVAATGSGTLGYQWRRNGFALAGATNATYTIAAASRTDIDYYDVVVANGLSVATTQPAWLDVAPTAYPGAVAIDPSFNIVLESPNAVFNCIVPLADGRFYAVGDFVRINGFATGDVARFEADGSIDTAFVAPVLNGYAKTLAVQADGNILVGGSFTLVTPTKTWTNLIRLNSVDGSLDASYNSGGSGPNGGVDALALASAGQVYIAGWFSSYDGTNRYALARLNADGSLDPGFAPTLPSEVRALGVQSDGRLLIGGYFTTVNGTARNRLARLNTDGTLDATFDPGSGANDGIYALALATGGKIYAGGYLSTYSGTAVGRYVRLNANGSLDATFDTSGYSGNEIESMAVQSDGKVLLGGSFWQLHGTACNNLARLNADGTLDASLAPSMNGSVLSVAVAADGRMLAGGYFTSVGSVARQLLARFNADGTLDSGVNPVVRQAGNVQSMVAVPGGKLVIAGDFVTVNGTARNNLARLAADGTVDPSFNPGSGPSGNLTQVLRQGDGKLVIAGYFGFYNGVPRYQLARINADGSLDPTFDASQGGLNGSVAALGLLPGGRMLVSGWFTSLSGGQSSYQMARLNTDGSRDPAYAPNISGTVDTISAQPDGRALIGGGFTTVNGTARNRIARLNADGSLDPSFDPGTGTDQDVWSLVRQPDGKILLGGYFNYYNATYRFCLARALANGALDISFANVPFNGWSSLPIKQITLQPDGKVLIAGGFSSINNQPNSGYLARLNADGTYDGTCKVLNLPASVTAMALADNGQLYFAVGNTLGLGRTIPASAPAIGTQPVSQTSAGGNTVTFSLGASGTAPLTYQWYKNGAAIAGATNAVLVLNNVSYVDAGSYSVTVSNGLGTITSNVVTLSGSNAAPTITAQPQNVTVTSGQSATLTVAATGSGTLGYQWRRNGLPIAGATGASYTLGSVSRADADFYDVLVYSGLSVATSTAARLSVAPTSYPGFVANDPTKNLLVERTNGWVYTVVPVAGGKFYVGGEFNSIDGQPRSRIARFNADGTLDATFTPSGLNGAVYAIVPATDGKLWIGGGFTTVSGQTRNYFARLNADGSLDPTFNTEGTGFSGTVYAIVPQTDGQLLVGGGFYSFNNSSGPNCLVRLKTDGTRDASFAPAPNSTVMTLALQGDGKILTGGSFNTIAGTSRSYLARLKTDGTLDATFDPGTGPTNVIRAIALQSDGKILIGGSFTSYNGTAAGMIARLTTTGALDASFATGSGFNSDVLSLCIQSGGGIVAGGYFGSFNGASVPQLVRLNADGTRDASFTASANNTVYAVAAQADDRILVGGYFSQIGTTARNRLARLQADGTLDASVNAALRFPGSVNALVQLPGGQALVAGEFTHVAGAALAAPHLLRLNADGTLDGTFNAGTGPDQAVTTAVRQSDGKVVLFGGFYNYNGVARTGVVRIASDGALDPTFVPVGSQPWNFDSNCPPVMLPGGHIAVKTSAYTWNNLPAYGLVVLRPDGTRDPSFDIGTGVGQGGNYPILALAAQPDGKLLVGGGFTAFNGQARNRIARLNADGSLDASFTPDSVINSNVYALAILPSGKILAGGYFNYYDGSVYRNYVMRLNADGSLDTAYTTATPNSAVTGFIVQEDGRILLRGYFTSVGGRANTSILGRLNADGTADPSFAILGQTATLTTLLLTDNGTLFGGNSTDGLIRYTLATAPAIATPPTNQTAAPGATVNFTVTATGTAPLGYQWSLNGVAVSGATSATLALTNVQIADAGNYTVTVSNPLGTAISLPASLAGSTAAPTISTAPQGTTVTAGQPATLTVAATGSGTLTYQWRRNGTPIVGATGATLNLGPATRTLAGAYDVVVASGLSTTISPAARLDVAPSAYPQVVSADPAFAPVFETLGGTVQNFLRLDDGRVLVMGDFTQLNGKPARNIARLLADGSVDTTFQPQAIDNTINAAAVQADGKIVIGGNFTRIAGQVRNYLARLNSDGTLDATFALSQSYGTVLAVAVQADGQILMGGGSFLRLNPDGTRDPSFVSAFALPVNKLAVQPDGKILAGCNGSSSTVKSLARLNSDGSLDATFVGAIPAGSGGVYAVRLLADGRMLVGGQFNGGSSLSYLVRLTATGAVDPSWSTGTGFDNMVRSIDVLSDNRILVAGYFMSVNGALRIGLARLQVDGALDTGFVPASPGSYSVNAVAALNDGTVLVGGSFSSVGGLARYGIARLSADGATVDSAFAPGLTTVGSVNRVLPVGGNKLVAAGNFTLVNGTACAGLARLNADGTLDASFNGGGTGPGSGFVNDALLQPDGKIVIAGSFMSYNGTARGNLARVNADGTLDTSFIPGGGTNSTVSKVYALSGGQMLALGSFTSYSGTTRNYLARVNADGSLDPGFDAGAASYSIYAAAVQADGKIVVGGSFTTFNGVAHNCLVRLLPGGAVDPAFTPNADGTVSAVIVQPDGRILIGGSFRTVSNFSRAYVARLNADGTVDATFDPGTGPGGSVLSFALQEDGRIAIAGYFGSVSGVTNSGYLARLSPTGALDTTFSAPGLNTWPSTLAMLDDGSLVLGGGFFTLGSAARFGLVRTVSTVGPVICTQPASATILAGNTLGLAVSVAGGQNVAYQWLKNGVPIAGANAASYTVSLAQAADAGAYSVQIAHSGGTLASNTATIVVNPSAPVLASKTAAVATTKAGSRVTLVVSLSAGSEPLTYQWSKGGVAIAGATNRALLFPAAQAGDAGSYRLTVSNSLGAVTSETVTLYVADTPDWAWRSPLPQGNSLTIVQFLNGRFLAGGSNGTILTSTDGQAWTTVRLGVANSVMAFAQGNGVYVALASTSDLWSSTDGLSWTRRESGTGADGWYLQAITFGAGRFVALGSNGVIVTSTDGASWTLANSGTADALRSVVYGGGKFMALGNGGRTFVSTDGLAWTTGSAVPESVNYLAYGAGRFVASYYYYYAYSSPDGVAWTRSALPNSYSASALQYTGAGFLAAISYSSTTSPGHYLISTDGQTWHEQLMGLNLTAPPRSIAYGASCYVMVGSAPETLLMSADGATWTRTGPTANTTFYAVAASDQLIAAVSSNGRIVTSNTGDVWTQNAYSGNTALTDITYAAGAFVAVGYNGTIVTSPDGGVWTNRTSGTSNAFRGVRYLVDRFYAVGDNGTAMTSPDGATWTPVAPGSTSALYRVAFGNSTYVMVGAGGTVLTSANGPTWATGSAGTGNTLVDVVYAAGKFVAVSGSGDIVTSPDGLAWAPRSSPLTYLNSVGFLAGKFYAFGSGPAYLTSDDGVTWSLAQHGASTTIYDAVVFNGPIVAVGSAATILELPLPAIATPPLSASVATGGSVTLSVTASGVGPFSYQWFKDGVLLNGATNATLTLANVSSANAGNYTVRVTNSFGSVTTSAATLTVPICHSADTNQDGRLSLVELTRVIELYNTRNGTVRTGRYKVQAGTEDGFAQDTAATANQTLTQYHSADSNRDGQIGLSELTRVIDLYNTRVGTVRTGQYHVQAGTEDGFAPGP
jgi:uncharacterized delta-60 repeat protein